jgi:hypothetical protein
MPHDLVDNLLPARDEKAASKIGQSYIEGGESRADEYSDRGFDFGLFLPHPLFVLGIILSPFFRVFIGHVDIFPSEGETIPWLITLPGLKSPLLGDYGGP